MLIQRSIDKIRETLDKAKAIWGRDFPMPQVSFELRGSTAGNYSYREGKIRLNRALLLREADKFIDRTPGHEAAHLVTRHVYGPFVKPHGAEWRTVMIRLGMKPERCHSYDVTGIAGTRRHYSLFCACMEHKVGAKIARKVEMGARYTCRKCKEPIHAQKPAIQLTTRLTTRAGAVID